MLSVSNSLDDTWHEGIEAARRGEGAAADALLRKCVVGDPANAEFVAAYLENLSLQLGPLSTPPVPANHLSGTQLPEILRQPVESCSNNLLFRLAPECLSREPSNAAIALALAAAYEREELYPEQAAYLNWAIKADPHNPDTMAHAAEGFARIGLHAQSIECWERFEQIRRNQMLDTKSEISVPIDRSQQIALEIVQQCREAAGLVLVRMLPTALPPIIQQADAPAASSAAPLPAVDSEATKKLTPIQRLEAAIRERPGDPPLYAELTKMYLTKGRDYDAERVLHKAKAATDNDPAVVTLWEDVVLLRLEKKQTLAQKRLETEGTDEAQAALAELLAERRDDEIEIYNQRCNREPTNANYRFQLGLRLKQSGRDDAAAQQFEIALKHGTHSCESAYELAQCCERYGQLDQAIANYRLAANAAKQISERPKKLDSLYCCASIAIHMHLFALGQRYLTDLLQLAPEHAEGKTLQRQLQQQARQYAG